MLDLPSRGDTCFAAALAGQRPDEVVLYNYSSDIDGPDVAWSVGQRNPTYVYRHVLRCPPNPSLEVGAAEATHAAEEAAPDPGASGGAG